MDKYRWTFARNPQFKVLDEDKGICVTGYTLGSASGWQCLGQPMLSVIRQMMLYQWVPILVRELDEKDSR